MEIASVGSGGLDPNAQTTLILAHGSSDTTASEM